MKKSILKIHGKNAKRLKMQEEIDRLHADMKDLIRLDHTKAVKLAERIIKASAAIGYERLLPDTHLFHADALRKRGAYPEARDEFDLTIDIARKLGDRSTEGRAMNGRGILERRIGNFAGAKLYYEKALDISREIGDRKSEGMVLSNIANALIELESNELALEYADAAYKIQRGTDEEGLALQLLGTLFSRSGDYLSSLQFFERALKVCEEKNNKPALPWMHNHIAGMQKLVGNYMEARKSYNRAIETAHTIGIPETIPNSLLELGMCEVALEDYASAEVHIKDALVIYSNRSQTERIGHCYEHLAQLELGKGNAQAAIKFLDQAAPLIEKGDLRSFDAELHLSYVKAYAFLGNWQMVAHHEKERVKAQADRNSIAFRAKLATSQEQLSTERERHETEIERMKREQLERELANSTLHLLAQTELLANIRNEMMVTIRKIPPTEPAAKELREKLRLLPYKSIDWEKFDTQFKAAHPEFTKKLLEEYSKLTAMESRICSLIRMNLKSEEIARLFCLSHRTVENHRKHIREKMQLKREVDLAIHLAKI